MLSPTAAAESCHSLGPLPRAAAANHLRGGESAFWRCLLPPLVALVLCGAIRDNAVAQSSAAETDPAGDRASTPPFPDAASTLQRYFAERVEAIAADSLADIASAEQWRSERPARVKQLAGMLGLDPMPERTPLNAVVTASRPLAFEDSRSIVVENLHFQSRPGLYVTANLYRPAGTDDRDPSGEPDAAAGSTSGESERGYPAVLYVCGHARVNLDGISYGNKVGYHHHGIWFARHGYVCLMIDTIQLGEITGDHHGTHHQGKWWWNRRGYTPAGVEAYNGIRAIDYLQSRGEVDAERIGVTGRSGGGAYSWFVAALDERVKVAVPVAGITSLHNHVIDGCVEGHCDCMYPLNTRRWDFGELAALVAPRPLLIANSDQDPIFPLDGVVEVHQQVRKIYSLLDAEEELGLLITPGPHQDTQMLRTGAFTWMNRHLKDDDSLITIAAEKMLEPADLKVLDEWPPDQRVTESPNWFVAAADPTLPSDRQELKMRSRHGRRALEQAVNADLIAKIDRPLLMSSGGDEVIRLETYLVKSEAPFQLPLFVARPASRPASELTSIAVHLLDSQAWRAIAPALVRLDPKLADSGLTMPAEETADDGNGLDPVKRLNRYFAVDATADAIAFFPPRGIGPTAWGGDEKTRRHRRRRFMLLGDTVDAARIRDVVAAVKAVRAGDGDWLHQPSGSQRRPDRTTSAVAPGDAIELSLRGDRVAAGWAMFASLLTEPVSRLHLDRWSPDSDEPVLIGIDRIAPPLFWWLAAAERAGETWVVFPRGSDGSSGTEDATEDLGHLAELAAGLIGEGRVRVLLEPGR